MGHLRRAAQLWIWLVLAAGGATVLAGLAQQPSQTVAELSAPTLWVFLGLAAVAHAFPVTAPRHQAYHATQAFLMATILLLSWPAVVLVVLVCHATEWLRRRRPWYIQLYNAAAYLLSAAAAVLVLQRLLTPPFSLGVQSAASIAAAIVAAAVFLLVNHGLTAIVLRLARDVSVADSGLFGWESLGVDGALLLVGIPMADAWIAQPLSLLVTSAPLALFYRALQLPSLERAAHRDRLTGLYNARHFGEALDLELIRAHHFRQPTSFVVATIDDVQHTLQRYGRPSLDFLAVALAERVAGAVREYDLVARLEEGSFGILLPNTGPEEAGQLATCVVEAVSTRPYDLPTIRETMSISVSAALATTRADGTVVPGLLTSVVRAAERSRLSGPRSVLVVDGEVPAERATESRQSVQMNQRPVAPTPAPPAASTPVRSHVSLPVLELVVVLPALGLSLTLAALGSPPPLEVSAAIVCLVVISELLAFDLYDRSSFSISFAPILAAGLLAGADGAMLATWSIALIRGLLRRTRWDKVLFNGSAFTLFGLIAVGIASATGRPLRASELVPLAAAAVAAAGVYYLHTFLIAFAVALDIGASAPLVWVRNFRWLFPHYLILGLMGLGLAVASIELGLLGTGLFLAPPVMMRFVLKQYTDRTIGAVRRLEATNAELRSASSLLQQRGEELALLSDVGQLAAVQLHADRLPALVAERCVPTLGDVCGLVWAESALGRAAHGAPGAEHVAQALAAQPIEGLRHWAEALATRPNGHAQASGWAVTLGGHWAAASLPGRDGPLGWLVAWRARAAASSDADADGKDNLELMREVARRLGMLLERETLLQEAAAIDALRAVDRAKSDFIATTAHELRTPLTSLQGYAELLRTDEIEPSRRDRWLHILQVEAAQIGLVLDQFLDVSRLESGWFKTARHSVDLDAVVHRVLDAFTAQAALSGHSFEADVPAALPHVHADSAQVERVLRNLVSNALKYAPQGGPVRIRARLAGQGEIEVCVEDHGLGIPPEWLGRLFERFERVNTPERASIRGTGLGLYIARQMVELNGGRIWATSEGRGRGATFHFTLCVVPRRARRTARAQG